MSGSIPSPFPRDDRGPHFDAADRVASPEVPTDGEPDTPAMEPWQEVEPGRFMPRRVRGSCVGRALG
ncbi:MAG: hypothetical protein D6753_13195 [Planctomycetota bacterium]|nr:MAG: hypothetical protein D6753_13195 [Planctomycetota bacterium]